jgi:hypothetical protein
MGIFYVNDVSNTNWRFPSQPDIPNGTQIGLISNPGQPNPALASGAHLVAGSLGDDPVWGYTQLKLVTIPEPSFSLVWAYSRLSVSFGVVKAPDPSGHFPGKEPVL